VGDFAQLAYPTDHFDAVMDNESVCHNDFASSRAAYREIARVLKPGGKLFVRTFATGTTGDGTGEPLGRNAWRVAEGPMLGKGLSRFTAEEDFNDLFESELSILSCDLLTLTLSNRTQIVREWILVLTKNA
jgi:SAM-dependent methyltransferase